jgi:2Fe-2S ferredoxin
MVKKGSVHFLPADKIIEIHSEVSVLDLALKHKVPIDTSCGGSGSCGACQVKILHGLEKLGPRTDPEDAIAKDRGFTDDERLACQIEPIDGLVIEIP